MTKGTRVIAHTHTFGTVKGIIIRYDIIDDTYLVQTKSGFEWYVAAKNVEEVTR